MNALLNKEDNEIKELEMFNLGNGKLILSNKIMSQISSLHFIIGDTEWSGLLFYDIIKGDIYNPKSLVIKAEEIVLLDIGTQGYTEYSNYGLELINIYEDNPKLEKLYYGHIHTHHKMDAFFSSTDLKELKTNVSNYAFYLSLIVNFEGEYKAKMVYSSNITTEIKFDNKNKPSKDNRKTVSTKETKEVMCVIDFEFSLEGDKYTTSRIEKIKKDKKEKEEKERSKMLNTHIRGFRNTFNDYGNDWNNWNSLNNNTYQDIPSYSSNYKDDLELEIEKYHNELKKASEVKRFIPKLIMNNIKYKGDIGKAVKHLYTLKGSKASSIYESNLDDMVNNMYSIAYKMFGEDFDTDNNIATVVDNNIEELADECIEVLEFYPLDFKYNSIRNDLISVFNLFSTNVEDNDTKMIQY